MVDSSRTFKKKQNKTWQSASLCLLFTCISAQEVGKLVRFVERLSCLLQKKQQVF